MHLQHRLSKQIQNAFDEMFSSSIESVEFQSTRKDFEGDITVVVFPMLRHVKMNPAVLGEQLGQFLVENTKEVVGFNVVKGFLNLVLSNDYYMEIFQDFSSDLNYGFSDPDSKPTVMVEYSSPNTNKPLHLGHIRNNLLGYSVAQILKAAGHKVYKTQIINDRGIHICKSMLAWKRFGQGQTPESTGQKGDKFVGNFYVKFDQVYKSEIAELEMQGFSNEEAKTKAPILLEAQEMLLKWESGDPDTISLWEQMNQWVYSGFEITYKNLGVDFDNYYYESQTYLLGKSFIDEGLNSGVFYRKSDGSVWCDLSQDGLDEKIVLRADGTAVYITQDIGTAIQRLKDFPDVSAMVYTVGNEQDYHFKVLFLILRKLGVEWADNLFHLSYGMVDLPSGKMKSREGTVVDADDLISEMTLTAKTISQELGKLETEDQIAANKYLSTLSYVDKNKIGIWGWSYGGYMSSLCLFKGHDIFKFAVAVAPVTNWRFYDTIYTERYMKTPQENPEGYDLNSPINFVNKLKGNYLLVHGSADDNVHYQNTMEMISALVKENKQFDLFIYPDKNHSI